MDISQIDAQIEQLRLERNKINAANFRDNITPRIIGAIGNTFVYRNNTYGHGGHWDSFRILRSVAFSDYHCWLVFEQAQIDCDGKASLQLEKELVGQDHGLDFQEIRGWVACNLSEYESNRDAVLAQLQSGQLIVEKISKPL